MFLGECGRDDALHLLFVMDGIENFFLWLGDISENFTDTIIVFRDEIIDELMNQLCVASFPILLGEVRTTFIWLSKAWLSTFDSTTRSQK